MFTLIISTPHLVCIAPSVLFLTVADNGSTVLYSQAIKCVLTCTVHVCNSRTVRRMHLELYTIELCHHGTQ